MRRGYKNSKTDVSGKSVAAGCRRHHGETGREDGNIKTDDMPRVLTTTNGTKRHDEIVVGFRLPGETGVRGKRWLRLVVISPKAAQHG